MKCSVAAILQAILDHEGVNLKDQQEALYQALSAVIRKRQAETHERKI